jgi:hypothetical protein
MTALMRGGANGHGPVLDPAALARMFDAHYRPDPRLPGWGLGFIRAAAGAHRVVGHDGFVPGFNSKFLVARTTASASSPSPTGRRGRSCGCRPS